MYSPRGAAALLMLEIRFQVHVGDLKWRFGLIIRPSIDMILDAQYQVDDGRGVEI